MSGLFGPHSGHRQSRPPSSRGANSASSRLLVPTEQRHGGNRQSRNFEDALNSDGTVHITPSVDEDKLGVVSPQSSRHFAGETSFVDDSIDSSLTISRNHPQLTLQPATPKVVPPTPDANPVSSSTLKPANPQSPDTSDSMEEAETDPKRRSLLRSPGTSSSPDLATLVQKAKERGGIVGVNKTPVGSKASSALQVPEPKTISVAPSSYKYPALLTPASNPRNRAASSTSSFSIISPDPLSPCPSRIESTHGKKSGKSSLISIQNNASMLSLNFGSKDKDSKSSMRAKTGAFFNKLILSSSAKDKKRSNSVTVPNSPSARSSSRSPVPPLPTTSRSFSSMQSNDVFSCPPSTGPKQLPTIRASVDSRVSEDDRPLFPPSYAPVSSLPRAVEHPQNATIKAGRRRSMSVGSIDVSRLSPFDTSGRKSGESIKKGITDLGDVVIATDDFRSAFKGLAHPITPRKSAFDPRPSMSSDRSSRTWKPDGSDPSSSGKTDPGARTPPQAASLSETPDDFGTRPSRVTSRNSDEDSFYTPSSTPAITVHLATPTSSQNGHSDSSDHSMAGETTITASPRPTNLRLPQRSPNPFQTLSYQSSPSSASASPNPRVASLRTYRQPPNRSVSNATTSSVQSAPLTGSRPLTPRSSTDPRSPSRDARVSRIQPRHAASASEPILVDEKPVITEDGFLASGHRTSNGAVGLDRRGSTYSHPSSMASSSDLNSSRYPSSTKIHLEPEELEARAKEYAAKCWNEDMGFLAMEKIAEWLGGTDPIRKQSLKYYMDNFDFKGMRLDNAFRRLCNKLYLKGEAQQLDRILEAFSVKFWECNSLPVYHSTDVVHAVAYALLLLNTDLHIADLLTRMSRADFLRNTLAVVQPLLNKPAEQTADRPELRMSETDDDSDTDTEDVQEPTTSSRASRSRAKLRTGSLASWKSSSNPSQLAIQSTNAPNPAEESRVSLNLPLGSYFDSPGRRPSRDIGAAHSGTKALEAELETLLKDMYNSVKAQQITQPVLGSAPGSASSLAPGSPMSRSRSQRGYGGPPDRMKRGSIRGLQTLLGSQSPYGSNSSSSVDGRISPSPSFATSAGDGFSAASSTLFTPTLGFASNLSHSIIKEAQEDDGRSVRSAVSDSSNVSISDEELALLGAPWAKEGMLCRKQYWETTKRRAKDKSWMDVFVVIQKGTMSMFTFGGRGASGGAGIGVGGGNWLANANPMGEFTLAHSLAHSLPPPGYNRQRPYCFVLTLGSGAVFFFQAGTEELVNEWVSTCNYWAARQSKEPLSGGVSNMEYGWNRLSNQNDDDAANDLRAQKDRTDTFSIRSGKSAKLSKRSWGDLPGTVRSPHHYIPPDRMFIHDWRPPLPPALASTHDEETQLEALQKQVVVLKKELAQHNDLRSPMQELFTGRTNNTTKALNNWEQKSKYLLAEIIKYESYVDSLQQGMTLRLKKRGEKVLEKALVTPNPHDDYGDHTLASSSQNSRVTNRGVPREETIQEAEEPLTPGPLSKFGATCHRKESADTGH
ncbi:uncharacterized protein EI90DRAFT_3056571 [Cantharellus anzutake]|uniref:uncharacterized protein n=1 Tax=Cantharellus anzutake TaxID=1750568 RepID=UPI0019052714|nr:uncharacterized protein EI90DRAFT_3056571 [Cantharellus anzutake]KAF8332104.1 hypothetical protein EI90DRAFT_3056571 [Cantharellus anzutake]